MRLVADWAESKIEREVQSIPFLTYDSLHINVLQRSLKVFNLSGQKDGYVANVGLLHIQELELIPLLSKKAFNIQEISVEGIELDYYINKSKPDTNQDIDSTTGDIPTFEIGSVIVKNGYFQVFDSDSIMLSLSVSANLKSLTNQDIEKPSTIPAKLTSLSADSVRFTTKNGLYNLDVSSMFFHGNTLDLLEISLVSSEAKEDIGKHVGHEVDWLHATIDSITLDIIDMGSLLKKPKISSATIYHPLLEVFRDKRLPFPKDNSPPLLRDILDDEKIYFSLDSIRIENGSVRYEEFVKEEKGPGVMTFEALEGHLTNFRSFKIDSVSRPRLVASCLLYGQSKLYLDISFPNHRNVDNTIVKGKLSPIDLSVFNRMISYVSVVEIKSGSSSDLEFEFSHTSNHAIGEMKFVYEDLAISFLEEQESEPDGVISEIKSFFVNSFIIDKNNDFDSGKFRVGVIDFKRDEKKSMFNFWWGSILSGFKSSTGVDASGKKIDVN